MACHRFREVCAKPTDQAAQWSDLPPGSSPTGSGASTARCRVESAGRRRPRLGGPASRSWCVRRLCYSAGRSGSCRRALGCFQAGASCGPRLTHFHPRPATRCFGLRWGFVIGGCAGARYGAEGFRFDGSELSGTCCLMGQEHWRLRVAAFGRRYRLEVFDDGFDQSGDAKLALLYVWLHTFQSWSRQNSPSFQLSSNDYAYIKIIYARKRDVYTSRALPLAWDCLKLAMWHFWSHFRTAQRRVYLTLASFWGCQQELIMSGSLFLVEHWQLHLEMLYVCLR